jgi:molybdopterin molybdotransferase
VSERYEFDTPAKAVTALVARLTPVGVETVDVAQASGRVLAEAVISDRPSPAVDVSAMDGYAVRCADAAAMERIPIAAHARIGREPPALAARAAMHIVTGAPLPPGADAVIRREDVQESTAEVVLNAAARRIKPGTAVRRRGENAVAGQEVVAPGVEIGPPMAGALAGFGVTRPRVRRPVRVAVLTTGDELVDAWEQPNPFQLRDSNGPALEAMLSRRAWLEVRRERRAADEPEALRKAVEAALDGVDALVLTGGVSMGDRDYVPATIRALGGELVFHKVPQRPGKPVLAAVLPDGRPILGLPGNPVSVLVTARRMAVPALERLGGVEHPAPPALIRVPDDGKRLDLWWHRLVCLTAPGEAQLADNKGSGDVPAAARSHGFVEVPPGVGPDGPSPCYTWAW